MISERTIWDKKLIGFGKRIRASGRQTWICQTRIIPREKQKKITLGTVKKIPCPIAKRMAKQWLMKVAKERAQARVGESIK